MVAENAGLAGNTFLMGVFSGPPFDCAEEALTGAVNGGHFQTIQPLIKKVEHGYLSDLVSELAEQGKVVAMEKLLPHLEDETCHETCQTALQSALMGRKWAAAEKILEFDESLKVDAKFSTNGQLQKRKSFRF